LDSAAQRVKIGFHLPAPVARTTIETTNMQRESRAEIPLTSAKKASQVPSDATAPTKIPPANIDPSNILTGARARTPSTPAKTASQVPSDHTAPMGLVRANPISTLPRKLTRTLTTLVLALSNPNPDLNPKAQYTQLLITNTKRAIMLGYFPVSQREQDACKINCRQKNMVS